MKKQYQIGKNETLTVTAILNQTNSSSSPYFSITGRIKDTTVCRDGGIIACGCLHEDILKADPSLSGLVSMHLSDQDGTPLYAVENGFYYLTNETHHKFLASHLRISDALAAEMIEKQPTKKEFSDFVLEQHPRWESEAKETIEKYALEVTK
jgi:hypothetical protein